MVISKPIRSASLGQSRAWAALLIGARIGFFQSSGQTPSIPGPPQDQTVPIGAGAHFWAQVNGSPLLGFQWLHEGTNCSDNGRITGSTTTNLTINPVQTNDVGNYQLIVTNSYGRATSEVARLDFGETSSFGQAGFLVPKFYISSVGAGWDSALKQRASVAFNGDVYLAVWEDGRQPGSIQVYGARISASGEVIDPGGVPISTLSSNQTSAIPRVSACGTNFLVVWNYQPAPPGTGSFVYGCRITGSGMVLDPAGIQIASGSSSKAYGNVAANSNKWLVVWRDNKTDASGDIYGTFVQTDGSVQTPGGFAIAIASQSQSVPALASNGTNFFVAWHDYRNGTTEDWDIYGTMVSAQGTVVSSGGLLIAGAIHQQWFPNVASDGSGFLVTWADGRNELSFFTNQDVYGAQISASGTLSSSNSIPICVAAGDQGDSFSVADGTNYFIVWSDNRNNSTNFDVYGTSLVGSTAVDSSGWAVDFDPGTTAIKPAIAGGKDHQYLVVHWGFNGLSSTYKVIGNLLYLKEPDLRLTWEQAGGGEVRLKWTSVPGLSYQVQTATQVDATWNPLPGVIIANSTQCVTRVDTSSALQGFYRVVRLK